MPTKKQKEEERQGPLTEKQIKEYIDGIYEGDIDADSLPENIYFSISNYLKKGLYKGFGTDLEELGSLIKKGEFWDASDLELLTELRENVYMFGAAKTYAMTKEISSLLIGDDDKPRTLQEFQEIAKTTYDNWNSNWGETEYSTAIGQGYAAVKWNQIEKEKDSLPNLKYSAIGDACPICMPLDGTTAPVDDHIWDAIAPLNHFNCKCILLQEDEFAMLTPQNEKDETYENAMSKMDDVFKSNSGKDGMVFNENHPYFEQARADKVGKDNFNMPIPEKD